MELRSGTSKPAYCESERTKATRERHGAPHGATRRHTAQQFRSAGAERSQCGLSWRDPRVVLPRLGGGGYHPRRQEHDADGGATDMAKVRKAVITAAGRGTRQYPAS